MRIRAAICLAIAFFLLPLPWFPGHSIAAGLAAADPMAKDRAPSLAGGSWPAGSLRPQASAAAAGSTAVYYPLAVAAALLFVGGLLAMRRSKPRLDAELTYIAEKSARVRALAQEGHASPEDLMHLSALDSRGQWWRIDPRSGAWQRYSGGRWRPTRDPTSRWRSLQMAGLFLVLAGIGTIVLLLLNVSGVVAYQ
jgi:hypothetical protein